ncbi:FdhF/YdeP family oxidoreductase [Sphingomonas montana]|uniref:FdhF/YdeP family oxidoreductase n=1 Tax=Sphingomonas montana TaxID=1843236 RepID=UPI001F0A0669|nr:FdhF/YdeP family oxidoreductase [Sphingomonas montana]
MSMHDHDDHGPDQAQITDYEGAAGGWGSMKGMAAILPKEKLDPIDFATQLGRQNKAGGFACVSCAWPKPAHPHPAEFCENGAKATAWEATGHRTSPEWLETHSVTALRDLSDYELEQHGRLTHPVRYDPVSDTYRTTSWATAFAEIGAELRRIKAVDPRRAVFYSSGRASLETSYMYQLMARMYGCNNLPDSSNMCHETTGVALKKTLGESVGTTRLDDFEHADAILFFGQNVGSNAPRMLHPLRAAVKRGCKIVTFNPLKERGLERFTDPQNPIEMATGGSTPISTQYHQVKTGGDIAVLMGMCKWLIEADDAAGGQAGGSTFIDHAFLAEHTEGYEALADRARATTWDAIEVASGLPRVDIIAAARVYAAADAVMAVYGMGLTQHVHGTENVDMLVNLLLLRGNFGKPGAGICPVRGHSNVQGQRTVGIGHKPEHAPLDILADQYDFSPPREEGLDTTKACEAIIAGEVDAFIQLGGNFVRAIPDTYRMEAAWPALALTVHVATKLNRSHLLPGKIGYVLPCIGRTERDDQATGPQTVSIEDSMSCIHASIGTRKPPQGDLMSEPAIVGALARQILDPNPKVDWDAWVGDYGLVRDAIEATFPDKFRDYNARMHVPGGFDKGNAVRSRKWLTTSGKAQIALPTGLDATGFADTPETLRLMTLRSNDQFNTTVYGYDDRFRGISGSRLVVLMNPEDIERLGLAADQLVGLETVYHDGHDRAVRGLRIVPYEVPMGCIGAYYPECNPLIPLAHHDIESQTLAAKSVPVRVVA